MQKNKRRIYSNKNSTNLSIKQIIKNKNMDLGTPSELILNNNSDIDSNHRLASFYDKETTNKNPNQIKSSTLKEVSIKNKDIKKLTVSDRQKERNIKSRSKSREKKERSRSASKDHMNKEIKEKRAKTPKARKKRKKEKDSSCYNLTTIDLDQRLNHENILYQEDPMLDLDDDDKLKREDLNALEDILSNQQNIENENEEEFQFQSEESLPMNQDLPNLGNKTEPFTIKFQQ